MLAYAKPGSGRFGRPCATAPERRNHALDAPAARAAAVEAVAAVGVTWRLRRRLKRAPFQTEHPTQPEDPGGGASNEG